MIEITRPGKFTLIIQNPLMIATGMMGFEPSAYRNLINLDKLGAVVTNGISWKARGPAREPRVVPTPGGVLLHTGLPNPGMRRAIQRFGKAWAKSQAPVIVHVIATHHDDVTKCAEALEGQPGVVGIELGLHDQVHPQEVPLLIAAARERCQLPLLVKLPLYYALNLAQAAQDGGADALVIAAPPRGTDRDAASGRLVGGRVYGPWLKAQTLRTVGQIAQFVQIQIIACGGIHTPEDARDCIEAGTVAVQIDTLTWVQPSAVEVIARNLGGMEVTRAAGALADEWRPGLGKTQMMNQQPRQQPADAPPGLELPEFPLNEDDTTEPADPARL